MHYPVFLERASDGTYGVGVPDLLGCVSAGDTIDEALRQVREAIIFHLEGMAADGEEAPAPRSIDHHRRDPDWATAELWALVEVPEHDLPGKAVRLNISMNERILSRLDAVAEAEGQTRSGLLQRLASEYASARQSRITQRAASKPVKPAKGKAKPARSRSTSGGSTSGGSTSGGSTSGGSTSRGSTSGGRKASARP